jgi:hypothetical protein
VSSTRNRLEIRVENQYFESTDPVAKILIDGEDLFSHLPPTGFSPFDPGDLLGPDWPLEPVDPPRRVAVYRCSCGEPGCGVVAPVITGNDSEVRWSDFRDFTGLFNSPLHNPKYEPDEHRSLPLPVPELVFDGVQYMAEVRRATADRSWETPARRTARFLKEMLLAQSEQLAEWGLEVDWVFPAHRRENCVSVAMLDLDHRYVQRPALQLLMTLSAPEGTPEDRAASMLRNLLSTTPEKWMSEFPKESW